MDPYNQSPQNNSNSGIPPNPHPASAISEPLAPYVPPLQPQTPQPPQQPLSQPAQPGSKPPKKSKKIPIILGAVAVLLLIVLPVLAVLMGSNKDSGTKKTNQPTTNTQVLLLQPAQAIDVEQTNNAINQDLSSLNDQNDFPDSSLDDKTLGL